MEESQIDHPKRRLLAAEIFSKNKQGDFITRSSCLLYYDLANVFSKVGV